MRTSILSIFIFFFSLSAHGETGVFGVKAEVWNNLENIQKHMYVYGLFDGLVFSKLIVQDVKITTSISTEQYITAIDDFYSDYKNSLIPIPIALKIITLEINGADKNTIESELIIQRRIFSKNK